MRAPLFLIGSAAAALLLGAAPLTAQERPDSAVATDTAAAATDDYDPMVPLRDFGGLARDFASDGWAVVTSPLRLDGEEAWVFAGAVGVGALLFAFDEPLTEAAIEGHDDGVDGAIVDVGEFLDPLALMGETNVYWASGALLGYLTRQQRVQNVFTELLFSHWLASITRKGIGLPIGRRRPETTSDAYQFSWMGGSSFPSGHASTITQVAAVLSHHIDRWPATVLLYGLAATVVYQRTAVAKHWASDSWIGAAWGWGVAQVVISRREAGRTDFVPLFDARTRSVGLRMTAPF